MKKPIFTVQKHKASHLHYDFRLQIRGVLKSWAIPKGPSMDPSVKRLAVLVDDHDLDYAEFEGVIEEGQYGAGPVLVWDTGDYEYLPDPKGKKAIEDSLREGKISFILHGKRLKGEFALVKLKGQAKNWLLIKKQDKYSIPGKDITEENLTSVLSNKNIEDLEDEARAGRLETYRCRRDSSAPFSPSDL